MFVDGTWGTVCLHPQNLSYSLVYKYVCNQVQSADVVKPYDATVVHGFSEDPVVAANPICQSSATFIRDCSFTTSNIPCGHSTDIGVICNGESYGALCRTVNITTIIIIVNKVN